MKAGRALLVTVFMASVSACATRSPVTLDSGVTDSERVAALALIEDWGFTGRVALSDGTDAGSGRLVWRQVPGSLKLRFSGAFGGGAWELESTPDGAKLRTGDGSVHTAGRLDDLVRRHAGWRIPVDYLVYWVRGMPAPQAPAVVRRDNGGFPESILQAGWTISIERWDRFAVPMVPARLRAGKDEFLVKLAIRSWRQASE